MDIVVSVSTLDLVLADVWEGQSAELHNNAVTAAGSQYGEPILSGITTMILCAAPVITKVGWQPPSHLTWNFDDAVRLSRPLRAQWEQTPDDRWDATVRSGDEQVGAGTFAFGERSSLESLAEPVLPTPGRTLFAGDRDLFRWWMERSCPGLPGALPDEVPWPVLVSLAGGLIVRVPLVETPHTDILNRAMEWWFLRPVKVGETVRCLIHGRTERLSKSRPGYGIWQADVDVVRDDDHDDTIARISWTIMFTK